MAKPAYRAYTVIKRGDQKEDFWLNIGIAFPHEDGEGFNILLQAQPLDGKLVLRTFQENLDEQERIVQKARGKNN